MRRRRQFGEMENALAPYERQLVENGKLVAIGELAAGVAHEINNPLFAILALSEFLLKELEPGTRSYERVELIQTTGLEIKEIVRGLLDFGREGGEERSTIALDQVVRQTVALVRRTNAQKGISIVERYEGPLFVDASSGQVKQVLLNLLGNARHATPDGGRIVVSVRRSDTEALVSIADSGPGVDESVRDRIFEPFFTTRRGAGAGLGLAVSLGIAQAHGGTIVLEPDTRGATFTLRLPAP
jgi:two-component system NtrC family sensor kinase